MDDEEKKFTIEQYKQVYDEQRQLWILFWRIPTIAVTISAGIFAVVFIYLWGDDKGKWLESGTLLIIGHLLTTVLAYVASKHRFFGSIWVGTLTKIEELAPFVKRIQRTTTPEKEIEKGKEYWSSREVNFYEKPSGEKLLIGALVIISAISLGFSMYAFFKNSPCSLYVALPSWFLILVLWFLFSSIKSKPRVTK